MNDEQKKSESDVVAVTREAGALLAEAISTLREAREIITAALCDVGMKGRHADTCISETYARHNRMFPSGHGSPRCMFPPGHGSPRCDCWVGRAAKFLKDTL